MLQASLRHYRFSREQPILFHYHSHPLVPEPIHDIHLPLEAGVVLDGSMDRYASGVKTNITRGGVWTAGILEPHGRQAQIAGSSVAVFIISSDFFFNMSLPGADHDLWMAPFNTPAQSRPLLHDEVFAELAERLIARVEADADSHLLNLQIQLTFLEFMVEMIRLGSFTSNQPINSGDYARLRPAIELLYRNPRPVNTSEAAELCGLSTTRFSQLFKRVSGLSFSNFSLRYRLSQVAFELIRNDDTLDHLADAWGFCDKSHLVHRFKEHYRVTPVAYRERHGVGTADG